MNLILLYEQDFIAKNKIVISGRRAEHVLSVHKAEIGKQLTVGLYNSKLGKGTVTSLSNGKIEMITNLTDDPPTPIPLTLILALPRPKSLKKALHVATTLGVKKIFLIETWKVDKSYWQSPLLQSEEIKKQLILGLEQAKDTVLPEVILKRRFKPFIEDEIPEIIKDTIPFVAHPTNSKPCPYNCNESITLAIGPEGGFTDYEVNKFTEQGFTPISIGERIQRVEFAIPAIIGKMY
jgi:16S rRNA (uracil1498-N3)-methyltransferase